MGAQVLLQIKVGHLNVSRRREEVTELVVEDDLTAVIGMLETLIGDVLVNELGHLRARDELTSGKTKELTQLRRHILLTVEAVVGSASLSLLTIRILLGVLTLRMSLVRFLMSLRSAAISVWMVSRDIISFLPA